MVFELDVKDKKLLYQLDYNARQTNQELARAIGVSKQVVGFRLKRLESEGVITAFYTIIDIAKLSRTAHKNFVRLQNITPEKEKEMIAYLSGHPNIVWLASCDGRFDFVFSIWAEDVSEINDTLREINQRYGQYFSERQIATIIRGEYFTRDYLLGTKERTTRMLSFFGGVPDQTKVDETHAKILNCLAVNARASAVSIASSVGISADAVADRIKALERAGAIRHYNIVPNESEYPYQHQKVLLSFKTLTDKEERAFHAYCEHHPNIVYIVKALGPWDYEIDVETETVESFRAIMMEIKSIFQDSIKDYSALHVYKVHKYNFCPSVPQSK